jgi:hypothetical protein
MELHKLIICSGDYFARVACWQELYADDIEAMLCPDAPCIPDATRKIPQHDLHARVGQVRASAY